MLLGIPDITPSHPGIDKLGAGCRVDPSVSVMRFSEREDALCLADDVSLYGQIRIVLGDVQADPYVGVHIGARTIVNVGSYLSGEGGLEIGEDVLIGPHVKLLSAGHAIDEGDVRINRNRITRKKITIADGAWIGAGAIVLEGVRIGRGAVVAAGSVVRQDVPDGAVVAGVPARLLRYRQMKEFMGQEPPTSTAPRSGLWATFKTLFKR